MTSPLLCEPRRLTQDDPIERWPLPDEDKASEGLSVSRSDIEFANITKEVVAIEIHVANRSAGRSAPTEMVLQVAPLGAFVPWQPLATLPVPALRPGEVTTVRGLARVVQPRPLGDPARIPPKKLLTALGLADEPSRRRRRRKRSADLWDLAADPMQLLMPGRAHWMGNLNVLIGKVDVERHLARALRVMPGRVNVAWFMVGSGCRDAYAFHMNEQGRKWDAKLYDMTSYRAVLVDLAETPPLAHDRWIDSTGTRMMLLALQPPRDCDAGTVEVHVTQRSTGREAVVEFSLDPNAAGPGCYVV